LPALIWTLHVFLVVQWIFYICRSTPRNHQGLTWVLLSCCACSLCSSQAFQTSNGTKQSVEEINRLIGLHIKDAAAHLGTMHVWQANAAIGKYVKKAAEEAAAGKLKSAVSKTAASKK
jgi:hypothetical protein